MNIPSSFKGVRWRLNDNCVVVVETKQSKKSKNLAKFLVDTLFSRFTHLKESVNADSVVTRAMSEMKLCEFTRQDKYGILSYSYGDSFGGDKLKSILYKKMDSADKKVNKVISSMLEHMGVEHQVVAGDIVVNGTTDYIPTELEADLINALRELAWVVGEFSNAPEFSMFSEGSINKLNKLGYASAGNAIKDAPSPSEIEYFVSTLDSVVSKLSKLKRGAESRQLVACAKNVYSETFSYTGRLPAIEVAKLLRSDLQNIAKIRTKIEKANQH